MAGCLASKVPLVIYEFGTFDQSFQWQTGSPLSAVNLTNYTAVFSVKAKITDTTTLIAGVNKLSWAADADTGVYLDLASTGWYRLYIKDTDTSGICTGHVSIVGVYNIFLINPSGETVLKQYGPANIYAKV